MWNLFSDQYQESVKKQAPRYMPKKGCKPKPLWMNSETLNSVKNKRHAWAQYCTTKQPADFERYKRIRHQTNEEICSAKRSFEKKIAKKAKRKVSIFGNMLSKRLSHRVMSQIYKNQTHPLHKMTGKKPKFLMISLVYLHRKTLLTFQL